MRIRVLLSGLLLAGVLAGCGVLGKAAPSTAATGPWSTVAAAPIELTEVAVAVHNGRIWVAGGLRPDGTASVAVLVFDPVTGKWSTGPMLSAPRSTMRRSSRRRPGWCSSGATSATP